MYNAVTATVKFSRRQRIVMSGGRVRDHAVGDAISSSALALLDGTYPRESCRLVEKKEGE